jgi:membrane protein insertase Oxa1/YidC/SpoIIIJ
MMQSGVEAHVENPKKVADKKKEEDSLEMAQTMQQQMLYMMPLMTVVISVNFQSGLILYWIVSTVFSIVQQYYFSGWGGVKPFLIKLRLLNNKK